MAYEQEGLRSEPEALAGHRHPLQREASSRQRARQFHFAYPGLQAGNGYLEPQLTSSTFAFQSCCRCACAPSGGLRGLGPGRKWGPPISSDLTGLGEGGLKAGPDTEDREGGMGFFLRQSRYPALA